MDPVADGGFASEAFVLGNLALMMRKRKVFAAGVQVERIAQVRHRHRRALDMPSGKAPAPRTVPLHEVVGVFLPERKIARVLLFGILHGVAIRGLQLVGGLVARELAVVGKRIHRKVDTLIGLIGMSALHEAFYGFDLVRDVLGGTRTHVGLQQVERVPVVEQHLGVVARQIVDVGKALPLALQCRCHLVLALRVDQVVLGKVPHIGDVAHEGGVPPERLRGAVDEVGGEERPEVADMRVGVHGRAACVKAKVFVLQRLDRFHLAGQRVVEAKRGRIGHKHIEYYWGNTSMALLRLCRNVPEHWLKNVCWGSVSLEAVNSRTILCPDSRGGCVFRYKRIDELLDAVYDVADAQRPGA